MSIRLQDLQNISRFLDRATSNGPEAIAWVQAKNAVHAEINRLTSPQSAPPVDNAHVAPGAEQFAAPEAPPAS